MAHTIWNPADRQAILNRFDRLSPDTRPKWGKLDAPRMITHVTDTICWSMGELTVASMKKSPIAFWPVNALIMFYVPWPKGVPTAPELIERKPFEWRAELDAFRGAVGRFVARDPNGPWTPHVAFGRLNGSQWGRLTYRHLDHHLTQFGV
jgi:hypothetical protein